MKRIEILLVEDNPADVQLTREAMKDIRMKSSLSVAEDGVEAMAFLRREGKHENAPRPDMILLDLNLPGKDGREVLEDIKNDKALLSIPVVILTTSSAEKDILRTYEHHASCYITKPVDLYQFIEAVKLIEDFWIGTAKLPHRT